MTQIILKQRENAAKCHFSMLGNFDVFRSCDLKN